MKPSKELIAQIENNTLTVVQKLTQKQLENIKIKEWEEKFDREQKAEENKENLREQRLKEKELEKISHYEAKEKPTEKDYSSTLENFDTKKIKEH